MVAVERERPFISVVKKHTPRAIKRLTRGLLSGLRTLGAKYHCPVCNTRVIAFQPLPKFYAENLEKYGWPYADEDAETCNVQSYSCPSCQASDRDRLYALYLQNYLTNLPAKEPIKFVDFAPSPPLSNLIRKLRPEISYRTADLLAEGVDDRVDITDLRTYGDNQFDFFVCSHVLEHVTDDRKALRELYRILKPGGRGILMVPIILSLTEIDEDPTVIDEGERWKRFGQNDHVRLYSRNGFLERVRETGFIVHQCNRDFFGPDVFARNGITDQSVLYVVEK